MKRLSKKKKAEIVAEWRVLAHTDRYLWRGAAEHIWYTIRNNSRNRAIERLTNYARRVEKMAIHCYYVRAIRELKSA